MIKLSTKSKILVGGGRNLSPFAPAGIHCAGFTAALLNAGHILHTGCCAGADEIALQAAISSSSFSQVHAFAAFSPSGLGAWKSSAVATIQQAHAAGIQISWLAGGPLNTPLIQRLMLRSIAALRDCSLACFFAPGTGSLKVARAALRSNIPVVIYCAGSAPLLQVPSRRVIDSDLWLYQPATQPNLF
jgi:hypothetical protein